MDLQADLIDRTAMEIRNKKTEVCVWACGCAVDGFVGVPAHVCPKRFEAYGVRSSCVRARAGAHSAQSLTHNHASNLVYIETCRR